MSLQTPSLGKAREDAQKHPLKAWMNLAVKHQLYHSASSHRSNPVRMSGGTKRILTRRMMKCGFTSVDSGFQLGLEIA